MTNQSRNTRPSSQAVQQALEEFETALNDASREYAAPDTEPLHCATSAMQALQQFLRVVAPTQRFHVVDAIAEAMVDRCFGLDEPLLRPLADGLPKNADGSATRAAHHLLAAAMTFLMEADNQGGRLDKNEAAATVANLAAKLKLKQVNGASLSIRELINIHAETLRRAKAPSFAVPRRRQLKTLNKIQQVHDVLSTGTIVATYSAPLRAMQELQRRHPGKRRAAIAAWFLMRARPRFSTRVL